MLPPNPGRLSRLDQIMPPTYILFTLIFPVDDVTATINQLKAGTLLLESTVPFLLGHVGYGGQSEEGKACLEILPYVEGGNLSIITHIQYLAASYRDVFPTSHAANGAVADPSHLPLSFNPVLTTPAPIFRLQINALKDGVILGFAVNHGVIDGTGLGILLREFGACCRSAKSDNPIPLSVGIPSDVQLTTRAWLDDCTAPPRELQKYKDENDEFICSSVSSQPVEGLGSVVSASRGSLSTRTFALEGRIVQGIKSNVNRIIGALPSLRNAYADVSWVSSNDIVVALAWMSFNNARLFAGAQPLHDWSQPDNSAQKSSGGISFTVNIRNRIEPPLPSSFLGNAILPVRQPVPNKLLLLGASGDHGEFTDDLCPNSVISMNSKRGECYIGLACAALSVRQRLNTMDSDNVRRVLSYINEPMSPKTIAYNSMDILVTSWRDMGTYHVDFGDHLGYPMDMRVADIGVGGMFVVLPKRRAPDEKWEVKATAEPDVINHLFEDTLRELGSI
ncbi:uncharacterized protein APUU_60002A [Aspergillus puulaauensis]|uniref:Trichothecene 3-O-acetyltransferase-like N-terminal domain-containing protein n=1 Tax=Aspergillus puulaauensis TaxID=1220207 RepID=A0A7R7XUB8_9EURO|nr:uncharacterized protein APUU_60002A [Aspergillus puulaauensis]BCS26954.1 hypothetical protein APUU_60002A [Aspergillus puulaauensis]